MMTVCCLSAQLPTAIGKTLSIPIEPTNVPHDARIRNPLLEEILWPRFVNPEWKFPGLNKQIIAKLKNKSLYKRESASWRRMLIQQPPTSVIGIVEHFTHQSPTRDNTHHEQILVKPDQKHLRMGHLYKGSKINLLSSCRETWVLSSWLAPQGWKNFSRMIVVQFLMLLGRNVILSYLLSLHPG